jgi:S-adenosylmethionine:tRNA ribosyltransferase-isomerase
MNLPEGNLSLQARQIKKAATYYEIEFSWNDANLSFADILHAVGKVPLPPYIRRDVDKDDADRYQTIFAAHEGSVAAPTASLHITPQVVADLEAKGIQTKHLTLHVGAGTFKPVKSETMEEHLMHAEWFCISASTINELLQNPDRLIIPVGTTCLRTLETLYWIGLKLVKQMPVNFSGIALEQWEVYSLKADVSRDEALGALLHYMQEHKMEELITRTQILIAPSYTFRLCHALVTNFHQPQSTLLLLVAAFIGPQWLEVYQYALNHNYRFLSYGDSGLLWLKQSY